MGEYTRPKRWSYRFELSPDLPEDVALHDFLTALTERNELSRYIKNALRQASLINEPVQEPFVDKRTPEEEPLPQSVDKPLINELARIIPKPNGFLNPTEVLRQRRAEAKAKLDGGKKA